MGCNIIPRAWSFTICRWGGVKRSVIKDHQIVIRKSPCVKKDWHIQLLVSFLRNCIIQTCSISYPGSMYTASIFQLAFSSKFWWYVKIYRLSHKLYLSAHHHRQSYTITLVLNGLVRTQLQPWLTLVVSACIDNNIKFYQVRVSKWTRWPARTLPLTKIYHKSVVS